MCAFERQVLTGGCADCFSTSQPHWDLVSGLIFLAFAILLTRRTA